MTLTQSLESAFIDNLTNITSRASRSEYWWVIATWAVASAFAVVIGNVIVTGLGITGGPLAYLPSLLLSTVFLVFIFPTTTLTIRRLHDLNKPTWWICVFFFCLLGGALSLVWLVYMAFRGTEGANQFGEDPVTAWCW